MLIECPRCYHEMDQHSGLSDPGARPQPGDVTICIRCAAVLVFDKKDVREPTEAEASELAKNVPLQLMRGVIMHMTVNPISLAHFCHEYNRRRRQAGFRN